MNFDSTQFTSECAMNGHGNICTENIELLVNEARRLQVLGAQFESLISIKDAELEQLKKNLQSATERDHAKAAQIVLMERQLAQMDQDLHNITFDDQAKATQIQGLVNEFAIIYDQIL